MSNVETEPKIAVAPRALTDEEQSFRREAALRLLAAKMQKGDTIDELAVVACLEIADEILRGTS